MKTILYDDKKATFLLLGLSFLVSLIFYFFLPNNVPMQWGADGSVNYTLPKILAVLVLPGVNAVILFTQQHKGRQALVASLLVLLFFIGMFSYVSFINH